MSAEHAANSAGTGAGSAAWGQCTVPPRAVSTGGHGGSGSAQGRLSFARVTGAVTGAATTCPPGKSTPALTAVCPTKELSSTDYGAP